MTEREHGTIGRYKADKCRCDKCRAANSEYNQRWRRARHARVSSLPPEAHGKRQTYSNYGCRCDQCRSAAMEYLRVRYRQNFDVDALPSHPDILSILDIANLLDMDPEQVRELRYRRRLPEPAWRVGRTAVWERSTIERWAHLTGRLAESSR